MPHRIVFLRDLQWQTTNNELQRRSLWQQTDHSLTRQQRSMHLSISGWKFQFLHRRFLWYRMRLLFYGHYLRPGQFFDGYLRLKFFSSGRFQELYPSKQWLVGLFCLFPHLPAGPLPMMFKLLYFESTLIWQPQRPKILHLFFDTKKHICNHNI